MNTKRLLAACALLAPLPAAAQPASAKAPATASRANAPLPDPAHVLALLERTAKAQIAVLRARRMELATNAVEDPTVNWVASAFYTGLGRLERVSQAAQGAQFLREVAGHYNYALPGAYSDHTRLDADNIAIGETYEEIYASTGEPGAIAALRTRLDWTLPYLTLDPAPARLVWWWSDALFMAPPVMARFSAQTGDPAYLLAADTQWWRTYERLWSREHALYFRDERFRTRKAANGAPVFWARGNGWVMGALPRMLEAMPADFPTRARYIETLRAMAESLAKLQHADGLWSANLLDGNDPPGGETTGSAFFVYAMAWGINHGVLERERYLPVVLRGWSALEGAVQPDGLLGFAQRTGDQPWPARAEDHALYGTGAMLLAGLEVRKLGAPVQSFPVAEAPLPARAIWDGPRVRPAAGPRDAAQAADHERARAERRAVYELAFEPARDMPGARPAGEASPPRADGVVNPRVTLQLAPPADRTARASVRFAPYRYDDILWENDRTAHRIYGPALEAFEPPSGSGIDAWGKNVVWPFMERQLKTGKQHDFHGEGIDFFNVGTSRGAAGLGIWQDHKLWTSRNWSAYRILKDGPEVADFTVDYAPWPVGTARKVWETRRFTLPLGSNFTRMVSTIGSDSKAPLLVAIGLQKAPTEAGRGHFVADAASGRFTLWTPEDPDKGAMGLALMVDPAMIAEIVDDYDNHLVVLRVEPGKPFVYYMGSTWSKSLDFHDERAWQAYVATSTPDFAPPAAGRP
ncbi:glycoside hydrolase family 88 protein [Novosphingobium profundi]|uniref:glycoside hydrolase family 88 protein n=1 Tax=Novosphingobium profundi TaxID=1774954 RepID=UPI001BDAD50C|nr:glycoside hydrolase family 88 protein [Novosphingobium profundi]MBT0669368.1 glycoside hydrolase family 88 protein [Novosphingobium profundi]